MRWPRHRSWACPSPRVPSRARWRSARSRSAGDAIEEIVGASTAATNLKDRLRLFAGVDSTVLIVGESGSGKELIAARDPQRERRDAAGPFVTVNCGAIPARSIESELFGHVKRGSFTGAERDRAGHFELADGRDALPRRDRHDAARPPGQAAARAPGPRRHARRLDARRFASTCASSRPRTRTSRRLDRVGRFRRGPLLQAERPPDHCARRCARGARTSRGSRCTSAERIASRRGSGPGASSAALDRAPHGPSVARERPRARERDRARHGPGAGALRSSSRSTCRASWASAGAAVNRTLIRLTSEGL